MNKTVLIQCATPPEFDALREAFGGAVVEKVGKRRFFTVRTASGVGEPEPAARASIVVLCGSIGKVWAAASAEFAIGRWAPGLVMDFGAAGALASGLEVGDLVLAEKVVEHDVSAAMGGLPSAPTAQGATLAGLRGFFRSGSWLENVPAYPRFARLESGVRATRGCIAAGDKDIQTPEDRARLAASVGALAATWESSAIGRVCKFHGVPYLSVRVITDRGNHDEFLAEYQAGVARALTPAARALAEVLG